MLVDIYNMTEYFDVTENLESQGSLKKTILILTFIAVNTVVFSYGGLWLPRIPKVVSIVSSLLG